MLGTEGCRGDPRRHNTCNRPRSHPYKNKSHLLRGRGSPAAPCTQLWGVVVICTAQPPPHTPGLPMASRINTVDSEPQGITVQRGGCGQPSEALQGLRAPVCSLGHSIPLRLVPAFKSLCPSPGAQPHSSGQPQGSGVMVLPSEPGPSPPASPTGCPGAQKPWSFSQASSLFFGGASFPLCVVIAPPPSPASVSPVLAPARGSGSARGGRLASGGLRPLAAG